MATLLLDADDTLWENHAYFLRAIEAFLDHAEERGHRRDSARHAFLAAEAERTRVHGYGSATFAGSLVAALEALEGPRPQGARAPLLALGDWIRDHPIELLPGVAATLPALADRHRLFIVTKGEREEQESKIARSGLARHVLDYRILPEKDIARYQDLVRDWMLDPADAWMVGNSPRSDMNPAKACGMRTVFIPHRTLWDHEHEDLLLPCDLVLGNFGELALHF